LSNLVKKESEFQGQIRLNSDPSNSDSNLLGSEFKQILNEPNSNSSERDKQ